jgi:hypothetical protein
VLSEGYKFLDLTESLNGKPVKLIGDKYQTKLIKDVQKNNGNPGERNVKTHTTELL